MKTIALYLRVSTDKQTHENQALQLQEFCKGKGFEIVQTYKETISGKEKERPEFKRMLEDASKHRFDSILVWSLDRFTREGTDMVWHYLSLLKNYNVSFLSYQEPYLNTDNEMVRDILYSILGALAKQERIRLSERTKAGLQRAMKEGKRIGRRKTYTVAQEAHIITLAKEGLPYTEIARRLGINAGSVKYALTKGMKSPRGKATQESAY